jgi:hypothetical protein
MILIRISKTTVCVFAEMYFFENVAIVKVVDLGCRLGQ